MHFPTFKSTSSGVSHSLFSVWAVVALLPSFSPPTLPPLLISHLPHGTARQQNKNIVQITLPPSLFSILLSGGVNELTTSANLIGLLRRYADV